MEEKKLDILYQNFISKLKIKQIRAEYNGDKIAGEKYKNMYKQLEIIRERRHLALIGEKREENVIYNQIAEILYAEDIESESVIESIQSLLSNIQYEEQKDEERPKKEIEVEI